MASDEETIERTAKVWIECGGDAEGLMWNVGRLYEKIKELENG